jgi:DNA-binding transcriptional LysR family regulator
MTYDQLVTLESIIESGSFKAASEKLHKSQPSLSVAIKKLEEEFGVQLFDRSEYRPKLTTEGRAFYQKARQALQHMRDLNQYGIELGMGVEPEIKISVDGVVPLPNILNNLKKFFDEHASTSLNLSVDYLSGTIEKLYEKTIDIGFTHIVDKDENIIHKHFTDIVMIPVCSKDLLPAKPTTEDLKKTPQVIVKDSSRSLDYSAGLLADGRRWHVTDMQAKYEIIKAGFGWRRLPQHMIEDDLKKKSLVRVPIKSIEDGLAQIYIAHHRHKPMGPVTKELWNKF